MQPTRIRCWCCGEPDAYLWYCTAKAGGTVKEWHCFRCGITLTPDDLAARVRERGVVVRAASGDREIHATYPTP